MKAVRRIRPLPFLAAALALMPLSCRTGPGDDDVDYDGSVVVGHELATEAVLRSIPESSIDAARTTLHVAYQHTSHGTHVSYGLYGLPGYKDGDAVLFSITQNASTPEAGKLDFQDNQIPGSYSDLSTADSSWSTWVDVVRAYLDEPANAAINVMMWSWCDITAHDVANGYLPSMQTLIDEYGPGSRRATPVTFVFMTGHAVESSNAGSGLPREQAALITDYCEEHGYLCLDYYSIDSHDMDGTYYEDASDDGYSSGSDLHFYADWQDAHTLGQDWYGNLDCPGGTVTYGAHNSQHITANRKAYAMWYILARIAGWNGESP